MILLLFGRFRRLTTALYQNKKKVLVLERHYTAMIYSCLFEKGFEWDVGLHYIGKVHDPRTPLSSFLMKLQKDN